MKAKKEPVRNPKLVAIFLLLLAATVPWYLPQGTYEPIIFGFPYWAFISIVMTAILASFLVWVIHNYWQVDDVEEMEDFHE